MRLRNIALGLAAALLLALPAFPQGIPTGTLSGHVNDADKKPLPGVTVTITSPALQGSRTVVTTGTGDFLLALLPAGEYKVSFDLEGFKKVERQIKISAAQTAQLDTELSLSGVAETIVVVGTADTVSSATQASTTYSNATVEKLPLNRDPVNTIQLNPGVNANGPTNALTISGAQSYESLYLVNGVVVNENVRGQPLPLYIEDAIQETTVSTSGISAEYGRFSGGVVNIVTKSGGNETHGTFRDWVTNPKWTEVTPVNNTRLDTTNQRYEGTLGGWLWNTASGISARPATSRPTPATRRPSPISPSRSTPRSAGWRASSPSRRPTASAWWAPTSTSSATRSATSSPPAPRRSTSPAW